MIHLGLAHLTALELPPPELAREAARAGFRSIGLRVHPALTGGIAYPLAAGTQAQREFAALLMSEGLRLNEIEFVQITPEIDVPSFAPMFEVGAALGAAAVTVSGDDPDGARLAANFAALCELAGSFGLRVDLEFMCWRAVGTLAQALAVIRRAGAANAAVLVDALHLSRSGGSPADLQAVPAQLLRAAQLCDAGADVPTTDAAVIEEAREGRLPPGEGTLPLAALLEALPADAALSVELPMRGPDARRRIAVAYETTQRLLRGLPHGAAGRTSNPTGGLQEQGTAGA
ncbi:Xylose isomerase [Hyphomicrobiales bacterium]|nr:Xylose isomerase [Hyphomicrobiales bacterium]CAH1699609.1 Xylose isomerase [Hyphomicrobiales bacterium]CAI0343961.1 Xylose isomerase [Hyphomicrobiales bacterium]